ncbi:sugar phosphate nucleotidyltransferase [bacterium]
MKAVVMAGGEGTRLRPLTLNTPKPLVPVCNKPIMVHILERLKESGINENIATLYYMADEIQNYFGDGSEFGVKMNYSIEETPLGTAGAVRAVADQLDETFVIMSGDAMTDFDITQAVKFHKKVGSMATIVLYRVESPLEFGVVITDDDGRIVRFLEKPGWGEVFSDTVNTGIYILDPAIFEYMEEGGNYDWSKDIFPALLEDGRPMYGCVLDGYWCDIGNLKQYREVHQDALQGKVKVAFDGKKMKGKIWVGENTEIAPGAKIAGPAIIGANCGIKDGAQINQFSIIGDNCIVEDGAQIIQTVMWNNSYVGRRAKVSNCVVCRNNVLSEEVEIQDGAVIGDGCNIGAGTKVNQQVKIWPDKIIVSGATINHSIVWGENWPGALFSALGVKGLANVEITPEYAAELGAAYGATLPKGSMVFVSRSPHKVARLIKRALLSGLMSVGVNVTDTHSSPLPLTRYIVNNTDAIGGIHVRISPYQPEMILIEFFEGKGVNLDTNRERKVESVFLRQDFRRAELSDVGTISLDQSGIDQYVDDFMDYIDKEKIRSRRFKIVIDYSHGSLSTILPPILGRLAIDSVSLNSFMDPSMNPRPTAMDMDGLKRLGKIVKALEADVGFIVDGEAEKIAIVDGSGLPVIGERLLAMMIQLIAKVHKKPAIATQIRAPYLIENIVKKHKGTLKYTVSNSRSLMSEVAYKGKYNFAGDTKGGFIFPDFQPSFSAMVSIMKILELKAAMDLSISELNKRIPQVCIESGEASCTWENKGRIMRVLVDKFKKKKMDLTDGMRLNLTKKTWVLVRPDPTEPRVHIIAEGRTHDEAIELVEKYKAVVEDIE